MQGEKRVVEKVPRQTRRKKEMMSGNVERSLYFKDLS
jgi:hypothetical protein